MNYDLDILFQNPKALATIYFPSTGTPVTNPDGSALPSVIYGLVETDFNTDVSSLYSSVDPGLTAAAQTGANILQGAVGGSNRVIKNIQQTLQRWDGHSSPSFTVPVTIVKYKDTIDIMGQVRALMAAPAGTYETPLTMKAPYGYGFNGVFTPLTSLDGLKQLASTAIQNIKDRNFNSNYQNISSQVYGTWTLKYSDWFIASDLIITHVSATIAKESIKGTNEPLYARLNVTFTTAYLPDARQIANWFLPRLPDYGANVNASVAVGSNNTAAPL